MLKASISRSPGFVEVINENDAIAGFARAKALQRIVHVRHWKMSWRWRRVQVRRQERRRWFDFGGISVVPSGTCAFGRGDPGLASRANILCRFATGNFVLRRESLGRFWRDFGVIPRRRHDPLRSIHQEAVDHRITKLRDHGDAVISDEHERGGIHFEGGGAGCGDVAGNIAPGRWKVRGGLNAIDPARDRGPVDGDIVG